MSLHCIRAVVMTLALLVAASEAAAGSIVSIPPAVSLANRADSQLRAGELLPPSERATAFYRQALELAQQALALDPSNARANFVYFAAKGRVLMLEGTARNVIALKNLRPFLDRALQSDPDYADALAAKGGMLLELPKYLGGDPRQAEQVLARAVQLMPTGPSTRHLYAKALLKNGKLTAAHEQLRKASHYSAMQRRYLVLVEVQKLQRQVDSELARDTSR
ncbi:MAG TPA: tetratricopeptide repeat protein [Candidatus Binatia bacterium]|nr:tetratricopeptide repeat protein [Candidatus Binatia bacterium]